jgi:hypothetical protein
MALLTLLRSFILASLGCYPAFISLANALSQFLCNFTPYFNKSLLERMSCHAAKELSTLAASSDI